MSLSYSEFKTFYISNIILFVILLFVIVYVIVNWNDVRAGDYFSGECVRPILITGIVSLVFHLVLTWDDDDSTKSLDYDSNNLLLGETIPGYRLGQEQLANQVPEIIQEPKIIPQTQIQNQIQNQIQPNPNSLGSKYKITNRFDLGPNLQSRSHSNSDITRSNANIFVSHKNLSKYGIKFN